MKKNQDSACASLICAVRGMAGFYNLHVSSHSLSKCFDIYPDNECFDEIMDFIGVVFGGKLIPVKDIKSLNNNDKYLFSDDEGWHFHNKGRIPLDCKVVYKFIASPSNELNHLNWMMLFRHWMGKESGIISCILISFTLSILALSIPLYMNAIYGRVIPAGAEASLWTLSVLLVSFFVMEYFLKLKRSTIIMRFIHDFSAFVESKYVATLFMLNSNENNSWGKEREKAIDKLFSLRSMLWALLASNFLDSIFCFIYIIVIAIIGKWLVLPVLLLTVIQFITVFYRDYKSRLHANLNTKVSSGLPLAFLDVFRANGEEQKLLSNYIARSEHCNVIEGIKLRQKVSVSSDISFLTSLQTVVIVICAYYLMQVGTISSGALFATIILSGKVNQSFGSIIHVLPYFKKINSCFNVINAALSGSDVLKPKIHMLKPQSQGWEFKRVDFLYDSSARTNLLNDINFKIRPGERIAIVGGYHSGKTTICRLLLGLIKPSKGTVLCPENNWDCFKQSSFYFPQNNFLYHDNLYDYFGCTDKNIEQLKKVLSLPFLQWIPSFFKGGLHGSITDTSETISLDKLQMLEICRFAISSKNMLVLDEPTAFVNPYVESEFSKIVKQKLSDEKTLILFTGRANLLHLVDRVIFIDGGRVAFDGDTQSFLSLSKN